MYTQMISEIKMLEIYEDLTFTQIERYIYVFIDSDKLRLMS